MTTTVYLTRAISNRERYTEWGALSDALTAAHAKGCVECGADVRRIFLNDPVSPGILARPTVYVVGACLDHWALIQDRITFAETEAAAIADPSRKSHVG